MPRIELLDFARGVALIAMVIYHFAFDLEMFGVKESGFISQPHWKYFARSIASSFLFLTGFSLYLAHVNEIRWDKWCWRMVKIVAAALLITIATYFATPDQYIFFGILHAIAFASLAGLLFLKLNVVFTIIIAIAVFVIGLAYETTLLDHWIWWWTGLSQAAIISSDYVPVFPWFSAPLLGIAAAKLAMRYKFLETLARPRLLSTPAKVMKFLGHHSLIFYLVHQPVMIAFLLGILYLLR